MRAVLIFVLLLGLSGSLPAADWALEIIPNVSSTRGQSIDTRNQAFVVLLTNTSDRDMYNWIEEFSWGYDNLTFAITRAGGTSFRVQKKPQYFTVNMAIPNLVKPGGHFAWVVTFSPDEWVGFPSDWKGSEDVSMQARFKIDPTPESKELHVWTGTVESPSIKVNLTRFLKQWYLKKSYSDASD